MVERLRREDRAVAAGLERDRVQVGRLVVDPIGDGGLLSFLPGDGDRLGCDVVRLEATGDPLLDAGPLHDPVAATEAQGELGGLREEALLRECEPVDAGVTRDGAVDVLSSEDVRLPVEALPVLALGLLASLLAPVLRRDASLVLGRQPSEERLGAAGLGSHRGMTVTVS